MSTTMAGSGVTRSWPRQQFLVAALVVSVLLNLFFIGGAVWARFQQPAPGPDVQQRFRELENGLNLQPAQRPGFDRYVAAMRDSFGKMRQQVGPITGSAWEEMAKPQPDRAKIEALFNQAADKRRELQRNIADETLQFLSGLTPEQRTKFVEIARERRAAWGRQAKPSQ